MEMRKIHYIPALLAALLFGAAVSCVPVDLTPVHMDVPGFENIEMEDHCIILRLDPSSGLTAKTKAGPTERGLGDLNENRVNTIDCFFYATGKTDEAPIFRAIGRTVEENAAVTDSTECFVKVYYNDEIARTLFGSTDHGDCEVFVIANAAIDYPASPTVDDLRESILVYDFSQQEVQPYFTMCSQRTAQVTLYTTGTGENKRSTAAGRVPLYRCAAKAQIFLKLPPTIQDVVGDETWTFEPCPDAVTEDGIRGIRVRLASGSKKTYANAEYPVQPEDYIHYAERSMSRLTEAADLVPGMTDYNYGHVPYYSYPMTWSDLDDNAANFYFSIPWRRILYEDDGVTIHGYGDPERRYYKISANVVGRKFEANGFYRTFVFVKSRGEASQEQAVTIDDCTYIVTPWVHEGMSQDTGVETISGVFIRYNFLVVEPDDVTLNNESEYTFKFSSSADMENYKVVIDSIRFYKYTTGSPVLNEYHFTDTTSRVLNTNIDPNEYLVKYNYGKGEIYFRHNLDNVYEQRDIVLTVTNQDHISQKVRIHQKPAIMLQLREAGDVYVNGYFGRVTDAGFGSNYAYVKNGYSYQNQQTSYWHCTTNYTGRSGYIGNYTYNSLDSGYGSILVTTDNMSSSISANFFTTEIIVSAFNASNHTYVANEEEIEYRIGDPRVRAGADTADGGWGSEWALNNYLYWSGSQERTNVAWSNPEDILICSKREEDKSLIAPRFLISSALNSNMGLSWEEAVKRGATYQEAGYPAGRWRLPSEAEIAFIVARQRDGVIPNLYATDDYYWVGSGLMVYIPTSTTAPITFCTNDEAVADMRARNKSTKFSCRFVYDLWYWGDTPASSNEYHPNGHKY